MYLIPPANVTAKPPATYTNGEKSLSDPSAPPCFPDDEVAVVDRARVGHAMVGLGLLEPDSTLDLREAEAARTAVAAVEATIVPPLDR